MLSQMCRLRRRHFDHQPAGRSRLQGRTGAHANLELRGAEIIIVQQRMFVPHPSTCFTFNRFTLFARTSACEYRGMMEFSKNEIAICMPKRL